jgi:hypothetical protein
VVAGNAVTATVKNGATTLSTASVTTTTDAGSNVVACFVLPVAEGTVLSGATVTIGTLATVGFGGDAAKTLEGKVYNVKPAQSLTLASVTGSHLGWLVGSDGKAYEQTKGYLPIGVTAVAMIAYVGNGSDCTNGLAIQLNASPETKNWNDAKTYASGLTAVPGGTWRLPSMDDWQNMFVGCAKSGDAGVSDIMNPIAGFKEKIGATGITWKSSNYWSSTDSGSYAWDVDVNLDGSNAKAIFYEEETFMPYRVLGCLAF